MATFDGTGLKIDRLADIKEQIQDELKDGFGNGINLAETSTFGILIAIFSERYFLLYELLEAVYGASFPNTSFGIYLDELSAFNGIIREPATNSTVDLTFTRSNGTNEGDVTIPIGTQASTGDASSTVIWITSTEGVILNGSDTGSVGSTANETGAIGALAGTITNLLAPPINTLSVTNIIEATLGEEEESDSELKIRREQQLGAPGTSTSSGIVGALTLLDEVRNATIVLNDTDITDGEGRPPHSFEAYVSKAGGVFLAQEMQLVFDAPLVTSNSIAVTIDAAPIAGSPIAFLTDNDTTMELIIAALVAEATVSQASLVGTDTLDIVGGSGTDVVIAATVTGGASQAGVIFSTQNSADQDNIDAIAQSLWDSKAAGIQTYGGIEGVAVDIEDSPHNLFFSEIASVRVWVRVTLTTDGDYDSVTAEPAIQTALVTYSTNELLPGIDVFNYHLVAVVSDLNIPGIDGMVLETSVDNSVFNVAKIDVDVSQFASISSIDITFP